VEREEHDNFRMPSADTKLSGSFEANRGRLPLPISGAYKLVRGFGPYSPEGLGKVRLQSNGWHLKGVSGARAQCIFDGIVSGIYYQGNQYIVTVRHGKYISVYINLASVSVRNGQKVSTRQQLGKLGSDNTMQFQLRNWNNLLNPAKWIRR
jgi:septal ring factor EnvC (AmiA/AmiB activator)